MPLARVTVQRQREMELHRALREMRTAIDKYKDAVDNGLIGSVDVKVGSEGYPPDLETLVEGVSVANDASGRKLKFLRRVPIDPLTNSNEWGQRAYGDKPDSTSWGGSNVYDVYSKSQEQGPRRGTNPRLKARPGGRMMIVGITEVRRQSVGFTRRPIRAAPSSSCSS